MPNPTWSQGPPRAITLATDFSSRCDRAMDRAALLATAWDARLVVLNVLEPKADRSQQRYDVELPSWRRPPDPEVVAAAQVRRDLSKELQSVEVRVMEGDPAAAIEVGANEAGGELIVVGIARDETLGRYFLGSTVDQLARKTAIPLLVAKSRPRPYREVLVATDFSPSSQHALTAAARFFPTASLTLLHAWEVPFPGFLDHDSFREQWRSLEQEACERFIAGSDLSPDQRRNLKVLIEHGSPEVLVRAYMEDKGVDLVVVGTHGRSGVFDVRLGGTAKRILEFAPGDVLLIREPKAVSSDASRATD